MGERTGSGSMLANAFNRGADARLSGEPLKANPYHLAMHAKDEARYWIMGWQHADRNYGIGVHGRWTVRAIPAVRVDVPTANELPCRENAGDCGSPLARWPRQAP